MGKPRGWRKQRERHAKAARQGWRNRLDRKRGYKYTQTGSSDTKRDRMLSAKHPGYRKTKKGGYFEYRKNRSDVSRRTRL